MQTRIRQKVHPDHGGPEVHFPLADVRLFSLGARDPAGIKPDRIVILPAGGSQHRRQAIFAFCSAPRGNLKNVKQKKVKWVNTQRERLRGEKRIRGKAKGTHSEPADKRLEIRALRREPELHGIAGQLLAQRLADVIAVAHILLVALIL